MSPRRHVAHLLLTAAALMATGAWAVSAFPLAARQSEEDSSKASQPQLPSTKLTTEPKVLHKVDAVYPPAAKNEGVEGIFRIDVLIGTGGRIKEARVVASAPTRERLKEMESQKGHSLLSKAMRAWRQQRSTPSSSGGTSRFWM